MFQALDSGGFLIRAVQGHRPRFLSHSSIAPLWNRQCRPIFWHGSWPSWASLYSVEREIFRYRDNSVMVITSSGDIVGIAVSSSRKLDTRQR